MILIVIATFVALLLSLFLLRMRKSDEKVVFIVVLGDIGRSPRMQYHALSFAKAQYHVQLFGYGGSKPHTELCLNPSIRFIYLTPFPSILQRLPRLVVFVVKVLWQSVNLSKVLLFNGRPKYILVQNPPSLPALGICWLVSALYRCRFVIDWHNYGYTIMALSVGRQHLLTRLYERYERVFGRFSTDNICVTQAMSEDLAKNWNIRAITMYDRPPEIFRSLDLKQKHCFLQQSTIFRDCGKTKSGHESTLLTERGPDGTVSYGHDRPALIISSTSWTEDEDFSILLNALDKYDEEAKESVDGLPSLVCVITGKGPQKEYYMKVIQTREWTKVRVFTPWLEPDEYPQLLACADLGVCLHKSSSGLDLPMKVIDMFGCGLPVCAIWFPCLKELVQHEYNGLVFNSDRELADQLRKLLQGFPNQCRLLEEFRQNLETFREVRWEETWSKAVLPIFQS